MNCNPLKFGVLQLLKNIYRLKPAVSNGQKGIV